VVLMGNKWVRSISFNHKTPADIERLKLIGKRSFSKYIKRLLDEEIKRTKVLPPYTTKTATPSTQSRVVAPTTTTTLTPKKSNVFNPMLKK